MFGLPELIFEVTLRPMGACESDGLDFKVPLVFFSAFERTCLNPRSPLFDQQKTIQLYMPGPWPARKPIMHVGFLRNVLCRAPLMPCFLDGNPTPTIPNSMRRLQGTKFPNGRADTEPGKGDGSRLYYVNQFMWEWGRGFPRRITVADTQRLRERFLTQAREKAWATRKRNRDNRDDQ